MISITTLTRRQHFFWKSSERLSLRILGNQNGKDRQSFLGFDVLKLSNLRLRLSLLREASEDNWEYLPYKYLGKCKKDPTKRNLSATVQKEKQASARQQQIVIYYLLNVFISLEFSHSANYFLPLSKKRTYEQTKKKFIQVKTKEKSIQNNTKKESIVHKQEHCHWCQLVPRDSQYPCRLVWQSRLFVKPTSRPAFFLGGLSSASIRPPPPATSLQSPPNPDVAEEDEW